ncbi:hypothetical protein GJ744_011882 [Endocarpon pusillum]|uniref:Uncharacterized protein n=1 Tax=Endocarpon pusillum TaxID=364733 RepID=A0A8H7ADY9_9EURO|nr:hypothetical protein GJ744_011882 [Endocarpon pusillum]
MMKSLESSGLPGSSGIKTLSIARNNHQPFVLPGERFCRWGGFAPNDGDPIICPYTHDFKNNLKQHSRHTLSMSAESPRRAPSARVILAESTWSMAALSAL